MSTHAPPSTAARLTLPRALWGLAAAVVAVHAAHTGLDVGGHGPTQFFSTWLPFGAFLLVAAACVTRALRVTEERGTWLAVGVGLFVYGCGMPYYNLVFGDSPPAQFPSFPDLLWLTLTPAGVTAIVLLVRAQARQVRFDLWLDGVIGGLALASIGATVLIHVVLQGTLAAPAANLTFVLCDLAVVGFAVATWGLFGWRPSRTLVLLTLGFAALAFQDSSYLHELVRGTLVPGTLLDSWWLGVMLVISCGAMLRPKRVAVVRRRSSHLVAVPFAFALTAVALSAYFNLTDGVNPLAAALNTVTLGAVVVRFALTARSQLAMLAVSRHEALTDALTGLGNRRRLLADLEEVVEHASTERPALLALFDLDGFKDYNDRYGHPAGDSLLVRLGAALSASVRGSGTAYRMGGDEFCVLAWAGAEERESVVSTAAAALTEHGEGFTVGCSYGFVSLSGEVRDASAALGLADRRMYERKYSARTSAARQSTDVLVGLMAERDQWLGTHMEQTTRLCEAAGRELGLPPEEMAPLVQAAALHDIGKAAIPDAILNKPGPLTDEEWEFMRGHVVIGERIIGGAPSLARPAKLVRWSHERYDGTGYPDGLAGGDIPLAARIIGACDAYDAMTSDRPYRRAMSPEVALAELRANAGTQFDPVVVEVLCRLLTRAAGPAPPRRLAADRLPAR